MRTNVILITIAAFAIGALAAFILIAPQDNRSSQSVKTTGTPLVGGPFELTDHTGKRVSERDFHGKYMLIYFGYTFCPDICPTELQVMSAAIDALGDKAEQITPVLITIDPERDTPEQLASYVEHFHKRLIGLTGSEEDIRKVSKAFKVYYAKAKQEEGEADSEADYLMDHSNIIYLMDKKGKYVAHYGHTTDPQALARKINKLL